jgi:hypothetical protein
MLVISYIWSAVLTKSSFLIYIKALLVKRGMASSMIFEMQAQAEKESSLYLTRNNYNNDNNTMVCVYM